MSQIADNIARVQERIEAACDRVKRDPADVCLIAVSKKKPVADIVAAAQAGVQHFGENRVEEAQTKTPQVNRAYDGRLIWHMIGHIQSRKARDVPSLFQTIHSIDSVKIAERLSRVAVQQKTECEALIQVNVSGEGSKGGLAAYQWQKDPALLERLVNDVRVITSLPGIRIVGLMTMAPFLPDPEAVRPVFVQTFALRETLSAQLKLALPHLSMGMTGDFTVAVEEGATMVRIGRAIFGERT